MAKHVRSLSTTITSSAQASAHVIAEAGQEVATRSSNAVQEILDYDQLPEWMKVDPYIKRGYRRQLDSFSDCFWSLFYVHNESVNIWSHLLPAIIYLIVSLTLDFQTMHSGINIPTADGDIFQLYILCTVGCLLLSAIYHGTNSHSEHISRYFLKLDYLGIVLSVMGTNISAAYFGLYGNLLLQGYYILFYVFCATLVFYHLLRDNIDGPRAIFRRASIFIALASTWFAPFVHKISRDGLGEAVQAFAVGHTAVMVLLYFLALLFYATHIPEKWFPNTFDLWGASHQLFHILIDIGQIVYLMGLRTVMLRQCQRADGPFAFRSSNETSLSLWIEPNTAMWSGFQPSFETCLLVLVESSVAMWEGTQVRNSSVHG